jgi:alpha-L-rhamnosidase
MIMILGSKSFPADNLVGELLQSSMIWAGSAPSDRQNYVAFRKTFDIASPPQRASLHIFADSRYILWINGRYVDRGPCRFDPKRPEYDTLDVRTFLREGKNVIAVLGHRYYDEEIRTGPQQHPHARKADPPWTSSEGHCGRIMKHAPGLTAMLEMTNANGRKMRLLTGVDWLANTKHRFRPSPWNWGGIPDRIDARLESGDWTLPGFDDSAWEKAVRVDGGQWGRMHARGIPLLRETEIKSLTLLEHSGAPADAARSGPLGKSLPLEIRAGETAVIDAGQFVQAYTVLDFGAEEGSQIETKHAQTYHMNGRQPGGVMSNVNKYTARAGRQTYMSTDTFGFKYLSIGVVSGRVTLHDVKVVNRLYPFDVVGRFASSDDLLDRLWRYSVNTMLVCSEDGYVDCASRERVEWLADAVKVGHPVAAAIFAGPGENGQPYYGDPRLLEALLRRTGQSMHNDGRVKAHHPSDRWDIHGFIEDYSCLWVHSLRHYCDATGDIDLVRELWPAVTAQLTWFLDRRTERGLVHAREFVYFGNPLVYQECEGATLNCYLCRALLDAAELAGRLGKSRDANAYAEAADELGEAINTQLWDERSGSYHGAVKAGKQTPPTVHAAVMGLYYDVAPPERRKRVQEFLLANYTGEAFAPYTHAFLFRVLYDIDTARADQIVLDLIRQRWATMATYETQTTSEGFSPGEMCHEAGAVPAYFLSRYVLGVRTEDPRRPDCILIEPRLGDLTLAEGVVVTPSGPVDVSWKHAEDKERLQLEITVPSHATATVRIPAPGNDAKVILDGREISPAGRLRREGRHIAFELDGGKHGGVVSR